MFDVPTGQEGGPRSFAIVWEALTWEGCRMLCANFEGRPPSPSRLLRALLALAFEQAGIQPVEPLRDTAWAWAECIEASVTAASAPPACRPNPLRGNNNRLIEAGLLKQPPRPGRGPEPGRSSV